VAAPPERVFDRLAALAARFFGAAVEERAHGEVVDHSKTSPPSLTSVTSRPRGATATPTAAAAPIAVRLVAPAVNTPSLVPTRRW
jgi:hypothetical protein